MFKDIVVNQGSTYKRFRAASRGRSSSIQKKTCHVRVVLESSIEAPVLKKATDKKVAKKDKAAESKKPTVETEPTTVSPEIHQANMENKMMDKTKLARQVSKPMAPRLTATKKTVNRTTSK